MDSRLDCDLDYSITDFGCEIHTYVESCWKTIEAFDQDDDVISKQFKIQGDPYSVIDNLIKRNKILEEQKHKASIDVMHTEAEIKAYNIKLREQKEKHKETKDDLEKCLVALKQLSIEREVFRTNISEKYGAYNLAKNFYKHNCNIYLDLRKENDLLHWIQICFFTNKLNPTFSVTLNRYSHENTNTWELLSIQPNVSKNQYSALKERLQQTNDIAGFICAIRKIFLMKNNNFNKHN